MKRKSAIKTDLFAAAHHRQSIDNLGDPLAAIEREIDFTQLAAQVDAIAPRVENPKGGRPAYPTETMVRILVLKHLYSLSDEQVEYQLLDRMSHKRFCGLADAVTIPDRTTIWVFENRIGEVGSKAIFEGVESQLFAKGYIPRCDQIIDATLVPAPVQHNDRGEREILDQDAIPAHWKPAKRRQKDTDASWTKKHGKSYHGYKLTINADAKYKVIRKIKTSTACEHDSRHFEDVLDPFNTSRKVYADWGYPSKAREQALRERGMESCIQRKGTKQRPLSACQQRRNWRLAKTQARVEHVFGAMHQMGGKMVRTVGLARASFAMTMMAACYNIKRAVFLARGAPA